MLQRIGDKWTVLLIMSLAEGPKRFSELGRMTPGISQRMLTRTLPRLERDGLVTRTVTPSVPPRVDYELNALGAWLREPAMAFGRWAMAHQDEIRNARATFDASAST